MAVSTLSADTEKIISDNKVSIETLMAFCSEESIRIYLSDIGITDKKSINLIIVHVLDKITEALYRDGGDNCQHVFVELLSDEFTCCECGQKILDHDRVKSERDAMKLMEDFESENQKSEEANNRGVSIEFVVDFCNKYNLWDISTAEVRRKFILPYTYGLKCRFVDLPHMKMTSAIHNSDSDSNEVVAAAAPAVKDIVGAATTFVSHSWAAKFGDLVSAISDHADLTRKIWLDIFAENQWPSRCQPDLPRFEKAIRHCTSFLLVCSSASSASTPIVRAVTTRKIAFFRLWCMYELYCAINIPGMSVVVKGDKQDCDVDTQMIRSMMYRADVRAADCSRPSDKEAILDKLRRSAGGLDAVNRAIRDVISGERQVYLHTYIHLYIQSRHRTVHVIDTNISKAIHTVHPYTNICIHTFIHT